MRGLSLLLVACIGYVMSMNIDFNTKMTGEEHKSNTAAQSALNFGW